MTRERLVVATRRSRLALAQTRDTVRRLRELEPNLVIEELEVVTTGDRIVDRPLLQIGGKGLFTKEIEEALLEGRADFAVHSMKDVPAVVAPGLLLCATPKREDARDAVVTCDGRPFVSQKEGARVGTTSLRRQLQLGEYRSDLQFVALRGNVDTRLRRCEDGLVEAVVLAQAGLHRLGWAARATELLPPEICLPAAGQGALALQCRRDDPEVLHLLARLNDPTTALCVAAERGVLAGLGASCSVPLAAFCEFEGGWLRLRAAYAPSADGPLVRAERLIPLPSALEEAAHHGEQLARELSEKAC